MRKKKLNQKQPIEQEDFSRYKDVFDNIEESYVELDLAGNIVFINDSICKALGYSAEELMGMNYKHTTPRIWGGNISLTCRTDNFTAYRRTSNVI